MAAFRSGIRWADIPSESFSRSHTAPGAASGALMLQEENAEQSYAAEDAAPEFENSQAGMNKYFATAAAIGDDSKPSESMQDEYSDSLKKMRCGKMTDAGPGAASPAKCLSVGEGDTCHSAAMPGFKGLLVATPSADSSNAGGASSAQNGKKTHVFRRHQRGASEMEAAANMTPAKRNRRTSGVATAGGADGASSSGGGKGAEQNSAPLAPTPNLSHVPQHKRRKQQSGARGFVGEFPTAWPVLPLEACAPSAGEGRHKRRSSGHATRRRSGIGGGRRLSEGPVVADSNLLLHMGAAAPFLHQLPGLVPPVLVPGVALPPGSASPALPGLLHPQVVEQQQRRASSAKVAEEEEDEEWQRRESARMKDIAIGKATAGYRNFVRLVDRERRSEADPSTPDPKQRCSKAQFQRAYQKWRKQLHQYDALDAETPKAQAASEADEAAEGTTSKAAVGGESEAQLATDQQEVDAILAFNKECEMAGL